MSSISEIIMGVSGENHHRQKDAEKFKPCNKLIARGSAKSSSNLYAEIMPDVTNVGEYSRYDVVGISAEGNRTARVEPDYEEIDKAVAAGSTFITDNTFNRRRPFNVGEREVWVHLIAKGYTYESTNQRGIWRCPK